ncbi:MAG TPA: 2-keto-4-pentenoate hydratase [Mycobacteriales bacterium]|jgi:2-keto-4-pentenoate hydratase|nr:2-keto-4-pentenoate hydratase [Mycobacteriales bacterium]
MSLSEAQRDEAAELLRVAEETARPIPPLTETFPGIDVVDAYEIQLRNIQRRLDAGARIHGHKVGLSSKAMQQMMGVDEPDYGHLLDDMVCHEDVPVHASRYLVPRVEVEVGFVLGDDLPGEGCTVDDVVRATDYIVPAIELIDSRIAEWKIRLPDTIADNASSAGLVLGAERRKPDELDITAIDAVLYRNGEQVAAGRSDAVLGNPLTAVAWLAQKVASFGVRLRAGHVILPGSCTRAYDVTGGDQVRAEFTGLGSVSVSFV